VVILSLFALNNEQVVSESAIDFSQKSLFSFLNITKEQLEREKKNDYHKYQ
jgi:hypothetical protein